MARAAAGAVAAPRPRKPAGRTAAPKRVAGTAAPKRAAGGTAAPKRAAAGKQGRRTNARTSRRTAHAATARVPRRTSGYAAGGAIAAPLPARVVNAPFARALRARGSSALDALLAGRGWIVLIGVLLAGIVFFNVDLLKLNREIAGTAEQIEQLKRENDRFRDRVAHAASSERVQEAAALQGLVLPAPGDVRYLKAHPGADAQLAIKRYTEPSMALVAPAPVVTTPMPPTGVDPATGTTPTATTDTTATTTGTTDTTGMTGTTTGTTPSTDTTTSSPTTGTTPSTGTTTGTAPITTPTAPTGTSTGTAVAPTG